MDLFSLFNGIPAINKLQHTLASAGRSVFYTGRFAGSSKALFLKQFAANDKNIVVLQPDEKSIDELYVELYLLSTEKPLLKISSLTPENLQALITATEKNKNFLLIAPYELLICKAPSKAYLEQSTIKLSAGGNTGYNELIEYLSLFDYQKDKFAEAQGQYSQRGAIIDFWSYSEKNPVRIEFDGDFIESIRFFDPDSQRSVEVVSEVTLAKKMEASADGGSTYDTNIFEYFGMPVVFTTISGLFGLNPGNYRFENKPAIKEEAAPQEYLEDDFEALDEILSEELGLEHQETAMSREMVIELLKNINASFLAEEEIASGEEATDLSLQSAPAINSNYNVLFRTIKEHCSAGNNVIICAENDLQKERLAEVLTGTQAGLKEYFNIGAVKLVNLPLKAGFYCAPVRLLILTDYEIFNKPYRSKLPAQYKFKKFRSRDLSGIKPGDFIVHEDYGIAKFTGLETITIGESQQESMRLLYNEGGLVYVNLNYLHLVKKYSAKEGVTPQVSTLGTNEWQNKKKKARKKIREAAKELIDLYARRKAAAGYSFGPDTLWQQELEASFIYEDTPDQAKVTEEVKADLESLSPMDRLVCGDVGFGKTEIAVRAAFKVVQDGKQVAVLVPTTILAEQHHNTFKDRLSQFPVWMFALSRFQTAKEQKEIVKQISQGSADIVIGTHRLLSADINFKNIGLLIIDEEHRFGVKAKEKLRSVRTNIDTLTLTATPIPRTLNLSLLGARDLSIISTPPPNRQPIYTKVEVFDVKKVKRWIEHELQRHGQVYIVHDRVQSIGNFAAYLARHIPGLKYGIAHGQMRPAELEDVFHGFLSRKFDVLISTKIIESGLDIPNVNTIIINRADRFGLAELHQLRGRVGRSDRQAYAYFLVPSLNIVNKKTLRRLQAIEEYTELGAGFNLSMRDLEIRGAGNLLGFDQSGEVNEIGFDLFLKLINEAVAELKENEYKDLFKSEAARLTKTDTKIDAYFDIGISAAYMPDQVDRLSFYTALFSAGSLSQLSEIEEELNDRFGEIPVTTKRLLMAAKLKFTACYALFERIIIKQSNIIITLPEAVKNDYFTERMKLLINHIVTNYSKSIRFEQNKNQLKLVMANNYREPEGSLTHLINFSKDIMKLYGTDPESISNNPVF
ncbi:MAG: transcription-repair coupling factor [Ignavibacteriaceae bacterium]|nr:transcription-repair coupling factor [Ignavibacteriaceae bacterium]